MADTPNSEPPDLIDFVNNGTVNLWIGGHRYRLRRPKVGEYRTLRESYLAMVDEISEGAEDDARRARPLDEQITQLEARHAGEGDPLDDDELAELRKLRADGRAILRDQTDRANVLRLGWIREVFEVLAQAGSPRLPTEDDDLEPWLADGRFQSQVIKHWMSVPLARGGR